MDRKEINPTLYLDFILPILGKLNIIKGGMNVPKRDNLVRDYNNDSSEPVVKNEDVEFNLQASDNDDLEALIRARKADRRVEDNNK